MEYLEVRYTHDGTEYQWNGLFENFSSWLEGADYEILSIRRYNLEEERVKWYKDKGYEIS